MAATFERARRRGRSIPIAPAVGLAALAVACASTALITLHTPRGGTGLGRLVPRMPLGDRAELYSVAALEAAERAGKTKKSPRGWAYLPPLPAAPVLGGRELDWWTEQLAALRRSSEPESKRRYALLVARAQANGLGIDAATGKVREDGSMARLRVATDRAEDHHRSETATVAARWSPPLGALVEELASAAAQDVTKRRSPSHPSVTFAPREAASGALVVRFAAGAAHDVALSGLTHLAQWAMLGASAHEPWSKLAMDLDRVGATLSVTTGTTESSIILEAPAPEFDGLAERLLRMCLTPKVSASALPTARARAIGVPSEGLDSLVSVLASTAVPQPGFTNDPLGQPELIREVTLAELTAHLAGPMAAARATVVVAGRFDVDRLEAALSRARSAPVEPTPPMTAAVSGVHEADSALDVHLLAYPMRLGTSERAAAAHLASAVIEERLARRLRGAGLAYEVLAEPLRRPWLDFLLVVAPFGTSPGADVGQWITTEIEALGSEPLSDVDLERNQRHVLLELARMNRQPEALALALVEGGEGPWLGVDVIRDLGRMTPERLRTAVAPWVSRAKAVHVVLSPPWTRTERPRRRR